MKITVTGPSLKEEVREFENNLTVEELLKDYADKMEYPVYLCKVNNCYRGLSHLLHHDSTLQFLDITTQACWAVYQNSLQFLFMKAVHDICGKDSQVSINNSLNKGLYISINPRIDEQTVFRIEKRMHELVELDLPIHKEYMSKQQALELANSLHLKETAKLLNSLVSVSEVEIFSLDDEIEIFYDLMVPSTGYLKMFALDYYKAGVILRFPHPEDPLHVADFIDQPLLYNAFSQANRWGNLMKIDFVSDLNDIILKNEYKDLFLMQEALHEKNISDIADTIKEQKKRIVLICGPSSSGKTTFAKRLCIQLRVNGLKPLYLGTDDYFVDADEKPLDENGEPDLESIRAVDTKLFAHDLKALLLGEKVDIPTFDFVSSNKIFGKRITSLEKDGIIVIEGIHSLNKLMSEGIDDSEKFKIYISPFTPIGIDHHNRISTTDARMLRRLVRDTQFRGRDGKDVINEWVKVRKSENINIFPYNSEADVFFNSNCIYELAVLKKYVEPILEKIDRSQPEYAEAHRILNFLRYIDTIEDDSCIISNSIMREFIGGSIIV